MTVIKLCGLMDMQAVEAVNALKPDYAGFICSRPFRRYVEPERLKEFRALLCDEVKAVGVFVNEPLSLPVKLFQEGLIDVIQLHGQEDNDYIASLRKEIGTCLIFQAVKIDSIEAVKRAEASLADLVIADGGTGEGKGFDHSLLALLQRDYLLAGGLNPDNVKDAVKRLRPYGVDTSSGIETDRNKDPEKMRAFVQQVRKADHEK